MAPPLNPVRSGRLIIENLGYCMVKLSMAALSLVSVLSSKILILKLGYCNLAR